MATKKQKRITFEKSSDNVFADIGFANPEREQLKAHLALQIYRIIKSRGLTQVEAGDSRLENVIIIVGSSKSDLASAPKEDHVPAQKVPLDSIFVLVVKRRPDSQPDPEIPTRHARHSSFGLITSPNQPDVSRRLSRPQHYS